MRLILWYVAAIYLFGPLIAAPFTGGASLIGYLLPFLIFDFRNVTTFEMGCWVWLAWFVISFFVWTIHQFIRMTILCNVRKVSARGYFQQTYR